MIPKTYLAIYIDSVPQTPESGNVIKLYKQKILKRPTAIIHFQLSKTSIISLFCYCSQKANWWSTL